ncbi:signal peptidase I [Streptomyces lunaelactis]|uniref:Signal peptidase I n=1 Tax=Streptomyces lunaelactis TaxID=1535768 RepID=A0A2R4T900_9ACTN|nr:signal peptidase I [Streptomyces lunaelactis]AVZ75554.1 signal peptidase I [Streptomyces lunaelactis]NUK04192.1 signal peptidase I [Streptomyces lunaelactis]NUK18633.1 signal peptidase I [Streptomyces lunaelactis]NUK70232.1 signal peptidase I [Streptomyces lunaelactis]NUK75906.1 signal peptidase I [Streptomyces lunaelactis]
MSGTGRTEDGHGRLGNALSGLAVAVGCVLFLGGFIWGAVVYQPYTVPTDSMSPSIAAGDRVLAQRIDGEKVRRGDIVVFRDKQWGDMPMVKRVVGVGGDAIACCGDGGKLTVNGKAIEEPYLRTEGPASNTFTATVPTGQLFLLGDERMGSLDSRSHLQDPGHGSVPRSAVTARLDAVAWPLDGGLLDRPQGFEALPGGVSQLGPVKLVVGSIVIGAVLILGGAAYGPIARRLSRPRRGASGSGGGSRGKATAGVG